MAYRWVLALVFCALVSLNAQADTISPGDRTEFQRIITAQISAFQADDGPAAYDFAAPIIKNIFPSPETFMAMVKQGYPQVYRPNSFKFDEASQDSAGRPTQKVTIIGPDGKTYQALYTMEKQPDGAWRIAGCAILEIPGVDA
jgi:Domain of unknown function (DUF4864)